MNAQVESWLSRRKWILVALGLPILVAAWWAFRPEKSYEQESASQPRSPRTVILSRATQGCSKARRTKRAGAQPYIRPPMAEQYLRLTDFTTSNGPDVHVLLARSNDESLKQEIVKGQLDSVELGSLKGNQGDQNYDLPTSVELQKYNAVVIYCERFHAVFGVARLEQF